METIKDAWSQILDYLHHQEDISEVAFKVWITCIEPRAIEEDAVVVFVHTNFQRKIILEHYAAKLKEAFLGVLGLPLELKVLSGEDTVPETPPPAPDLNMFGNYEDESEFTFSNFVVGSSNKFAHAASLAVASRPAGIYNPLFIYGHSGLGKTHLLYAICNDIQKNFPKVNMLYTKGENMTNELIEALQKGPTQIQEFRAKYRRVDVLLVDDIQFISGKTSTQEEFFHTFDTLYQAKKQIVLTSDRPPKEIAALEERLRTRFESGLLADVQPPDLETRIAIIRRKVQQMELPAGDDVIEYIAEQLKSNIRQLEGVVKKMRAQYLLEGEFPSRITAQNAIRDIRNDHQPTPVTVQLIINEVARTFNVSPEDIRSNKRSGQISKARQVAAFVVREITNLPMKAIGEEFGARDHSTIVYAIQRVEENMNRDPSYKGKILDIIKNISSN